MSSDSLRLKAISFVVLFHKKLLRQFLSSHIDLTSIQVTGPFMICNQLDFLQLDLQYYLRCHELL